MKEYIKRLCSWLKSFPVPRRPIDYAKLYASIDEAKKHCDHAEHMSMCVQCGAVLGYNDTLTRVKTSASNETVEAGADYVLDWGSLIQTVTAP